MASYTGPGTILGGLPIIADVSWGTDWYGEGYAEIDAIYWRKRDGSKGKQISQTIFDRAEIYDSYFSNLVEQLSEHCMSEAAEACGETYPEPQEMISLDLDAPNLGDLP
jgi:hypothetical protein